jgi:hypothetical protein
MRPPDEKMRRQLEEGEKRMAKLEKFLRTTDTIPDDLWYAFHEAVNYDSATPVSWAGRCMKILYLRTENGESISVPKINAVLTKDTFQAVITEQFSEFMYGYILEK